MHPRLIEVFLFCLPKFLNIQVCALYTYTKDLQQAYINCYLRRYIFTLYILAKLNTKILINKYPYLLSEQTKSTAVFRLVLPVPVSKDQINLID